MGVNSSTRIMINTTGNVGISTVTPRSTLDVNGILTSTGVTTTNLASTNATINNLVVTAGAISITTSLTTGNTSRKIVVFDGANNNHQYFDFGANSGEFRYQVATNTVDDHVFYAGTGTTTSNELFRIKGSGLIGINTPTPSQLLTLSGGNILLSAGNQTGRIAIQNNSTGTSIAASGFQMVHDGVNAYVINYGNNPLILSTNNTIRATLYQTTLGNLSLGTNIQNRKLILHESTTNDHQYYGFGINTTSMRFQIDATSAGFDFYAVLGSTSSNQLMSIKGTGFVGIGTGSPAYPLHLEHCGF
jgi:hypothetical protein